MCVKAVFKEVEHTHTHTYTHSFSFSSLLLLLLVQISSLVTLQLLAQVSHDDQLDAPKYKCAVSMDFICAISRCVVVTHDGF